MFEEQEADHDPDNAEDNGLVTEQLFAFISFSRVGSIYNTALL